MGRVGRFLLLMMPALALASGCARLEPGEDSRPVTYSLTAGFEERPEESPDAEPDTRTTLTLNEAGTSASVHWTAGDRFLMIRGWGKATYSTTQSGKVAAFTTRDYLPSSGACSCFYPAERYVTQGSVWTSTLYSMALPSVQQAVAGGIQEGLHLSVAYASSPTSDLTFRNILCYIRFRLTGEATRQVQSVILDAGTTVAGDLCVTGLSNPSVYTDYTLSEQRELKSSTIRLKGPFTPGEDYFIALAPVTLSGFDLHFRDAQGRSICKHSTKTLSLKRSRIYDFGTIALGDDFDAAVNHTETTVRYRQATAAGKPIDLCVIPDGFRAEELPTYDSLARRAIDFLFDTEPYKTYADHFNVYIMDVASEESGASVTNGNGSYVTRRNTYFSSGWAESSYDDMAADEDRVFSFVGRNCPSLVNGTRKISEVPILLIINDSRYGAISHIYADGRGYAMAPYSYRGNTTQWYFPYWVPNGDDGPDAGAHVRTEADWADIGLCIGDWRNTATHEFGGHVIGRLYDEYWSNRYNKNQKAPDCQSWAVPLGLNVTHQKDNPQWKSDLLDCRESLIARDTAYRRIGVFQGAGGMVYNLWRSEKISCMMDNRPYFSAWQRILIVRRIASLSGTSFSLNDFFARDVTTDPLRSAPQATTSVQPGTDQPAPIVVPMPAPPVLHDATAPLSLGRK